MSAPGTFRLRGASILRATDKALLVEAEDLDEEVWVPRSVVHDDSEVWDYDDEDARGPGDLVVKEWWAEKQGWC